MAAVVNLSADQLTDADCDRLFGHFYWYPGAAAMRERLGPAELRGYRCGGLEGVVGLLMEEDPVALYPWTPAVAAGIRDEEAVALALLQAAQAAARAAGKSLATTLRDPGGLPGPHPHRPAAERRLRRGERAHGDDQGPGPCPRPPGPGWPGRP